MMVKGGGAPKGELLKAIDASFGSFDKYKEGVLAAATTQFGSGWAWLVKGTDKPLAITKLPNQDSPVTEGQAVLLGVDVWEHAYYLKYQNLRARLRESSGPTSSTGTTSPSCTRRSKRSHFTTKAQRSHQDSQRKQRGKRTEVRDQKSEIRRQKSKDTKGNKADHEPLRFAPFVSSSCLNSVSCSLAFCFLCVSLCLLCAFVVKSSVFPLTSFVPSAISHCASADSLSVPQMSGGSGRR